MKAELIRSGSKEPELTFVGAIGQVLGALGTVCAGYHPHSVINQAPLGQGSHLFAYRCVFGT